LKKKVGLIWPILSVGQGFLNPRGGQVLKRKGKEKLAQPPYQKMSLTFSFFHVSHFSLFFLLKTLINIKLTRKN